VCVGACRATTGDATSYGPNGFNFTLPENFTAAGDFAAAPEGAARSGKRQVSPALTCTTEGSVVTCSSTEDLVAGTVW
jgi:hypothetical protein